MIKNDEIEQTRRHFVRAWARPHHWVGFAWCMGQRPMMETTKLCMPTVQLRSLMSATLLPETSRLAFFSRSLQC
jgi:hypothetical protein